MSLFSISDLQQFSGIKTPTIRMWEQRYNALNPTRSQGNTRYYDSAQLRRLLNIVSLMNGPYKISELCSMSDEYLNDLLEKNWQENNIVQDQTSEYLIAQFISACIEMNEDRFDKIFANAMLKYGVRSTYTQVIYPALVRLGVMWTIDTLPVGQEHFITNLIRQKLHSAIDAIPSPTHNDNAWLLFLMEDELHETGLLLAQYMLRKAGKKVYYLGANVPREAIESAVNQVNPAQLLFFQIRKNDPQVDLNNIEWLKNTFPEKKIYLSSDVSRLPDLLPSKNFIRMYSVLDLEFQIAVSQ